MRLKAFLHSWVLLPMVFLAGATVLGTLIGLLALGAIYHLHGGEDFPSDLVKLWPLAFVAGFSVCLAPALITGLLAVDVRAKFRTRIGFHVALAGLYFFLAWVDAAIGALSEDFYLLDLGIAFALSYTVLTAVSTSLACGWLAWRASPGLRVQGNSDTDTGLDRAI